MDALPTKITTSLQFCPFGHCYNTSTACSGKNVSEHDTEPQSVAGVRFRRCISLLDSFHRDIPLVRYEVDQHWSANRIAHRGHIFPTSNDRNRSLGSLARTFPPSPFALSLAISDESAMNFAAHVTKLNSTLTNSSRTRSSTTFYRECPRSDRLGVTILQVDYCETCYKIPEWQEH